MPSQSGPDTDELLDLASQGEGEARQQLLTRHRDRLRKMVAYHMDRRVAGRIDPSDVVQEALADAARELSDYLRRRPVPFYPWLRQLAWDRLVELHRRHLHAGKRSVRREEPGLFELPDESAVELAGRLASLASSPSAHVVREELRRRVREALTHLGQREREVLVLRHLEQLSVAQAAEVLGVSEGAVKVRHVRALDRIRAVLDEPSGE